MARIIYSPKDIYEQEFKVSMRGFDRSEVDEFLDNVINDYELFLAEIEKLKAENARLAAEVKELAERPREVVPKPTYGAPVFTPPEASFSVAPKPEVPADPFPAEPRVSNAAATNFDILKRISRLEKEVFGKQIME